MIQYVPELFQVPLYKLFDLNYYYHIARKFAPYNPIYYIKQLAKFRQMKNVNKHNKRKLMNSKLKNLELLLSMICYFYDSELQTDC